MIDFEKSKMDETGLFVSLPSVVKELLSLRNSEEYSWLKEMPSHTCREALLQCDKAWDNFFKHRARHPRYKSKKLSKSIQSFHFDNDRNGFYFKDGYVRIPGLPGRGSKIQCKSLPFPEDSLMYKPGIIYDGIDFWLTAEVEIDRSYLKDVEKTDEVLGIDVGCANLAYVSDGTYYKPPKLRRLLKQKSRNSRRLSKMLNTRIAQSRKARTKLDEVPMTKNEQKLYLKQRGVLKRISNIKTTYAHTITTEIANKYPSMIVVEDLDIRGMMSKKFHKDKDQIYSEMYGMWAKIRDYLKYKSEERGITFVLAERGFPSSQICSRCGAIHKPGGTQRTYHCSCGLSIDRDLNAAINLSHYGMKMM